MAESYVAEIRVVETRVAENWVSVRKLVGGRKLDDKNLVDGRKSGGGQKLGVRNWAVSENWVTKN